MADFCKQCADDMGFEESDFAWMKDDPKYQLSEEDKAAGMGWGVLCEGCGPTVVTSEGVCIAKYCDLKHGEKLDGV